ncbi:MAG: SMI1/KNR4 family protein [Limisphaerales bacterium]
MPTNNDFRFDEWVRTAKQHIESLPQRVAGEVESQVTVEPPLSASAHDSLVNQIARPIPASLRAFLERGSAGFEFRYKWTPKGENAEDFKSAFGGEDSTWGGGALCQASSFAEWLADCKSWAEDTWVAEYPEDLAFWTQSFPILRMDTADFIALDQRSPSDDPAVVYLSHDDESKLIAPSFTAFLRVWERLHYVGPDSWMIEPFLDDEGLLSAGTEAATTLRRAYGDVA